MSRLDADAIRASLGETASSRLEAFELFTEIASTNTYLVQRAAPAAGAIHVALTDNQVAGRGRHGRIWQSPPGAGVCLSMGYTFAERPDNLSALTLAIGLGVIESLESLGINGVALKWPNDLVANDGKLGGILTEAQALSDDAVHVVTGVGLNVDLPQGFGPGDEPEWAGRVVDLAGLAPDLPHMNAIAASLVDGLCGVFATYEQGGFAAFTSRWPARDWLRGRELTIDTPRRQLAGTGAGVADDGALLVDGVDGEVHRVNSGSVVAAGRRGAGS